MKSPAAAIFSLALAAAAVWAFGIRVVVLKPAGNVAGRTVVFVGLRQLHIVDSPDAQCIRTTGEASPSCRDAARTKIETDGAILLKLPYSQELDSYAERQATREYQRMIPD